MDFEPRRVMLDADETAVLCDLSEQKPSLLKLKLEQSSPDTGLGSGSESDTGTKYIKAELNDDYGTTKTIGKSIQSTG